MSIVFNKDKFLFFCFWYIGEKIGMFFVLFMVIGCCCMGGYVRYRWIMGIGGVFLSVVFGEDLSVFYIMFIWYVLRILVVVVVFF